MNIIDIAYKAVKIIKDKYGLPNKGILAGGALGNTIWEVVSKNKAVINDLDIFIYTTEKNHIISVHDVIQGYTEYSHIFTKLGDVKYSISSVNNDGIYNYINYNSFSKDPMNIINSFDINATQVAYDIENDKFYYTEDFKEFLSTSKLKVIDGHTPQHTAIRIVKKANELGVDIPHDELEILSYLNSNRTVDNTSGSFTLKYKNIYDKYSNILNKYFKLNRNVVRENELKLIYYDCLELYSLSSVHSTILNSHSIFHMDVKPSPYSFNIPKIHFRYSKDFLFYMRNIQGNIKLERYYEKLHYFYKDVKYITTNVNESDLKLLSDFIYLSPVIVTKLNGYDFNTQIAYIKKIFNAYDKDPIVGIKLIEKLDMNVDIDLSPDNLLLYELLIRKEILDDPLHKVDVLIHGKQINRNFDFDIESEII